MLPWLFAGDIHIRGELRGPVLPLQTSCKSKPIPQFKVYVKKRNGKHEWGRILSSDMKRYIKREKQRQNRAAAFI